ncbi:E3 ubiquitin-protein ligase sina-like isoform X2 [Anabrus simplex]|uniref:E3 ubiquitin-protein ligase sina-like isoform X2 n=1 Tax=Anabrus simplex TaxID=316456 RepID=UPI0035A3178A
MAIRPTSMLPEKEVSQHPVNEGSGPITIASLFTEGPIEVASSAFSGMQSCKKDPQAELLKCMECPVCYRYMVSVIEECKNGHCICADCRKNMRSCPQCKSVFTGQRNRLAEKMAAIMTFPCQNFDAGCSEMMSGEELIHHYSLCQWRMYNCFVLDCRWVGRSYDILDHFKNKHRANVLTGEANTIIWKNGTKKNCFLMCINEALFICIQEIIEDIFAVIVQFIGPREKASDFQYKLELMSREKEYQAVFKFPVVDDTETAAKIFKSGGGIQLATPFIKTFVDSKNTLVHKLEVTAKE